MNTIEIRSIPKIVFAHSYETEKTFENFFDAGKNFIEICYVCEGEIVIHKGSEVYVVQKGDIECLIHDEPVKIYSNEKYHCHHTIGISAEWEYAESISKGLYLPLITRSCKEIEEIKKSIDECIYSSYKFENSDTKVAHRIFDILCKIDEVNRKNQQPEYSILAERAKKYIQKNIYKMITQKEIAEHLGITPGHLCNVFKQAEGMTLVKYVNALKLKNVESVMKKEKIKLYEAAQMFGYQDANYVSSLYKKMYGKNITEHFNSILKEPK